MNDVNPYESPQVASQDEGPAPSPLKLPAWGILTISWLALIVMPVVLIVAIPREARMENRAVGPWDVLPPLWMIFTAAFGLDGGRAMLRMKYRRLVVATAILACVPYVGIAGGCFTAGFGLIALMRLRRKEVWDAFQS